MPPSITTSPPLKKDYYRLAALDLDGTLLRSDKTIGPRTASALREAHRQGLIIVLATGRHPASAARYLQELGLLDDTSCAICYNGAGVVSVGAYLAAGSEIEFPLISSSCASGREITEIARFAHAHGCRVHGYSRDRGLLVEDENPYSRREIDLCRVGFKAVDFTALDPAERFFKVLIVGEGAQLDALRPEIPRQFKERFGIMRSDPNFLEFIPEHASKGSALKALCASLSLDAGRAVAFGDAENDLSLIQEAGLGVAMANAYPILRDNADLITLSNDEEGIAEVLERILNV